MDQAICLGGRPNTALKIDFDPLRLTPTAVPSTWRFVVASSMVRAEKSGGAREIYNRRGIECREALGMIVQRLPEAKGVSRYPDLVEQVSVEDLVAAADTILDDPLQRRFRHVVTEADRVEGARRTMVAEDIQAFGRLMSASHNSLRDDYEVSCSALDELVDLDLAMGSGAVGARLTGAGLGGCIVALCPVDGVPGLVEVLSRDFYGPRGVEDPADGHVIVAQPSDGASVTPL
jgi:galactokinase